MDDRDSCDKDWEVRNSFWKGGFEVWFWMMKKNHSGGAFKADCSRQVGCYKRMIFHQTVLCSHEGWQRYTYWMQNVAIWSKCMVVWDQKDTEGICRRGNWSRWLSVCTEYGVLWYTHVYPKVAFSGAKITKVQNMVSFSGTHQQTYPHIYEIIPTTRVYRKLRGQSYIVHLPYWFCAAESAVCWSHLTICQSNHFTTVHVP